MLIDGKLLNVKTKKSDCIEKRTSANSKEERDLTFLRHYIAHIENQ